MLTLQSIYADPDESYSTLLEARWPGKWDCPKCGSTGEHYLIEARNIDRCVGCGHEFSVTSGTILSGMKLKHHVLVASAFVFCANAKGISSIQLGKTVGISQKTAWLLMHKFREAIMRDVMAQTLSGMVEIDGATFGGHMVQENSIRDGFPTRIRRLKRKDRRIIVVARERDPGGRTVPLVGYSEAGAVPRLLEIIKPGSVVIADEAHAWDEMKEALDMLRVSHKFRFSENGTTTNYAESFWSVLRRTHRGIHHKWGGEQVQAYACEIAWRQDTRALTVEDRVSTLLRLVLASPVSEKWAGYHQRITRA